MSFWMTPIGMQGICYLPYIKRNHCSLLSSSHHTSLISCWKSMYTIWSYLDLLHKTMSSIEKPIQYTSSSFGVFLFEFPSQIMYHLELPLECMGLKSLSSQNSLLDHHHILLIKNPLDVHDWKLSYLHINDRPFICSIGV